LKRALFYEKSISCLVLQGSTLQEPRTILLKRVLWKPILFSFKLNSFFIKIGLFLLKILKLSLILFLLKILKLSLILFILKLILSDIDTIK
jgi:hypothetical protein